MASSTGIEKPLKKQIAAAEREARDAGKAARTPRQKAVESRYQEVLSERLRPSEDPRLTSSELLRWLRSGEPLAQEGWQERWKSEFDRLADALGSVEDPRDLQHPLVTVLAISILAMLCGRDGADAAHYWGVKNEEWLRAFLPLPNGIPSQDCAGHGRLEQRRAFVFRRSENPELFDQWFPSAGRFIGIESVVRNDSTRTDRAMGKSSKETRYYISSRKLTAKAANEAVRKHWRVENQLHWVLDVTFGADQVPHPHEERRSELRLRTADRIVPAADAHGASNVAEYASTTLQRLAPVPCLGARLHLSQRAQRTVRHSGPGFGETTLRKGSLRRDGTRTHAESPHGASHHTDAGPQGAAATRTSESTSSSRDHAAWVSSTMQPPWSRPTEGLIAERACSMWCDRHASRTARPLSFQLP